MSALLVWRERIKTLYEKWGQYVKPAFRFVLALISLLVINSQLGYNPGLKSHVLVLAFSVVSIFFPVILFLFLVAAFVVVQVASISAVLAAQITVIFLILYFVYVRFVPEHGYTILLMALLSYLKLPYILPLLLGVLAGPIAVLPAGIGVACYYLLESVKTEASAMASVTTLLAEDTLEAYNRVIRNVISNTYMLYTIAIYTIVIVVVYVLRRQKWNNASQIAILCGAVTNMMGFLIVDFLLGKSDLILGMLVGTIFSTCLAVLIQLLRLPLNYSAIEIVQFEDDEFYYYVKAIPKMNITKPDKQVTRINPQKENENTANLRDAIQEAYSQSKEYVESIPEFDDDVFELDDFVVEYDEKDFLDD